MSAAETDGEGPNSILLDTFTITVSPTPGGLSLVQARKIKDIAEDLVEASFEAHNWGPSTVFQHMGFTVDSLLYFDNDESYSVIWFKEGIVSFDGSSQGIPTQTEIQDLIREQLDPSGGRGAGLTAALQATPDFSFVQETIYDVLEGSAPDTVVMPTSTTPPKTEPPTLMPTPAPTQLPTSKPTSKPTLVPTRRPTEPPTFDLTLDPTKTPTERPSATPTEPPTLSPVAQQTEAPTSAPPTEALTAMPVATSDTSEPTQISTSQPTSKPTLVPTRRPTEPPTFDPTLGPTKTPTERPSATPTEPPTLLPVAPQPEAPTSVPTSAPLTEAPTALATSEPTALATSEPTALPSSATINESIPSPSAIPLATSEPTAAPSSATSIESMPPPLATSEPTSVPSTTGLEAVPTAAPTRTSTPPVTAAPVASEPVAMDTSEPTAMSLVGYSPTQMPISGQGTPSGSQVATMEPSAAPSSGLVQSQAIDTHSSRTAVFPVIAGSAAGLLVLFSLAFLLVYKRRREKGGSRKNATYLGATQEEDDLKHSIKSNDLMTSEPCSSKLGSMLLSTAAAVHCGVRATTHQSEATPSQSSSDDDFSGFDEGDFVGCGISVKPVIIPIGTDDYEEAIEVQERERDVESGIAALAVTSQVVADEPKLAKEPPSTDKNADDEEIMFIERIVADFYGESCVDYAALMRPPEPNKDVVERDSNLAVESAAALPHMAALRVDTGTETILQEEAMEKDTVERLNNVVEPEHEFDANTSSLEKTAQVDSENEATPEPCRESDSNIAHANHDEVDKDWYFDSGVDEVHIKRHDAYAAERDCDLMLYADSSDADSDVFEDIALEMETYAEKEQFERAVEINGDPINQDHLDASDSVSDVFDDLPDDANDSLSDVFDSLEVDSSTNIFDNAEAIPAVIGSVGAEMKINTSQDEDLSTIAKIDSFDENDRDASVANLNVEKMSFSEKDCVSVRADVLMKADAVRPTTKEFLSWEEPCTGIQPLGDSAFLAESPDFSTLSTIRSNRWSDVSSEHSLCLSMSDDNDDDRQEFTLDESWDFNDNSDDSSDVVDDIFQSASTLPSDDTRPLLGNSGAGGFRKQAPSDKTVNSNAPTDNGDGDSDVSLCDPFQTPATTPVNDDTPLLDQVRGTYKLEKVVTTGGGEKRRRSKSAPPRTDGDSSTGSFKKQTSSGETVYSNAPTDEFDYHSVVSRQRLLL